jgi:hypothetical protein
MHGSTVFRPIARESGVEPGHPRGAFYRRRRAKTDLETGTANSTMVELPVRISDSDWSGKKRKREGGGRKKKKRN